MISPTRNIINMLKDIGITEGVLINSIIILTLMLLIVCMVEYVFYYRKKGDKHD